MNPLLKTHKSENSERLVIEWDNRKTPKQGCLSLVLPVFWCCWTGATLYGTWLAATDDSPKWTVFDWISLLMIGAAWLGVIGIAFTWILRYSVERIEIGPDEYHHHFVKYPWFAPIRWTTSEISSVEVGHQFNNIGEIEAVSTLNVFAGSKRDMVAYWVDEELKRDIFCQIRDHLHSLGLPIDCRDTLDEEGSGSINISN
ncbi:MAG: hypothetical protein KDA93_17320 [Planctomycetaceae bacterium]|nr:hypothetical protein [Planctomycetaceae bacterium]